VLFMYNPVGGFPANCILLQRYKRQKQVALNGIAKHQGPRAAYV